MRSRPAGVAHLGGVAASLTGHTSPGALRPVSGDDGRGTVRDVVITKVPTVLSSGLYAIPAACGATLTARALELHFYGGAIAVVMTAICFFIRMDGVHFNLNVPVSTTLRDLGSSDPVANRRTAQRAGGSPQWAAGTAWRRACPWGGSCKSRGARSIREHRTVGQRGVAHHTRVAALAGAHLHRRDRSGPLLGLAVELLHGSPEATFFGAEELVATRLEAEATLDTSGREGVDRPGTRSWDESRTRRPTCSFSGRGEPACL
ncbi:MAG: hypothetical protein M0Z95_28465 [Actinomycetota bacterium]|nr:hypothetical protein [Actinomycetota bacterium]